MQQTAVVIAGTFGTENLPQGTRLSYSVNLLLLTCAISKVTSLTWSSYYETESLWCFLGIKMYELNAEDRKLVL